MLTGAQGNARLAIGGLAEEIARLRAEPGEGEIAIGGAAPAAEAAASDLIDEYRAVAHPVLVGGGTASRSSRSSTPLTPDRQALIARSSRRRPARAAWPRPPGGRARPGLPLLTPQDRGRSRVRAFVPIGEGPAAHKVRRTFQGVVTRARIMHNL